MVIVTTGTAVPKTFAQPTPHPQRPPKYLKISKNSETNPQEALKNQEIYKLKNTNKPPKNSKRGRSYYGTPSPTNTKIQTNNRAMQKNPHKTPTKKLLKILKASHTSYGILCRITIKIHTRNTVMQRNHMPTFIFLYTFIQSCH